jgi:hypothetical protein
LLRLLSLLFAHHDAPGFDVPVLGVNSLRIEALKDSLAFVQGTCCRAVEKMRASSFGSTSGHCWRGHALFCLRSGILQRLLCTGSEIEPAIFAWYLLLIFKMIIHFAAAQAICILLAQQNIFIDFLQLYN